jgi:GPI mannosyltransferase 3
MGCNRAALKPAVVAVWHDRATESLHNAIGIMYHDGAAPLPFARLIEWQTGSHPLTPMNQSIGIDRGASATADGPPGIPDAAASRREDRLAAAALVALIGLAIGLRLVPILVTPSINWGDEIFQITEQAHRLVYGYGLVPWEFQLGIRSWLLPGFVAGLMELARAVRNGPDVYLPVIAVTFAAIGAVPVFCCFQWCRRKFGLAGALIGGATVAMAPELVYFGARTLSEVFAAHLLVLAWYVIDRGHAVGSRESRRRIAAASSLLAVVCLLRVQLAPTVAVVALWSVWDERRVRLVPMLVGGSLVLLLGALFDMATLGSPLASIWRYVLYNTYYGVSSGFSTEPWYYYLLGELGVWGSAAILLIFLVGLGARQMPCLFVAALTTIAVHSGIAHKEYRFIYPAVLMLMVLAGLGLANLAQIGAQWLRRQGLRSGAAVAAATILALASWGGVSAKVWTGPALASLRFRLHDELSAVRFVRGISALCGVGLYGKNAWVRYGGYTYLDRPVPMFWPSDDAELMASAAAFDTLLYDRTERVPPAPLGFKALRCFGPICIARRQGGCAARPMSALPFPAGLQGLPSTRRQTGVTRPQ